MSHPKNNTTVHHGKFRDFTPMSEGNTGRLHETIGGASLSAQTGAAIIDPKGARAIVDIRQTLKDAVCAVLDNTALKTKEKIQAITDMIEAVDEAIGDYAKSSNALRGVLEKTGTVTMKEAREFAERHGGRKADRDDSERLTESTDQPSPAVAAANRWREPAAS